MDDSKIEKWTLEDGRRAEKRITELNGERVIELHVEEERPLKLQQRVVEKSKPIVYERKIETIDEAGNVVEQKVESIEPKIPMQVVEHILANSQAIEQPEVLTKKDVVDIVVAAIKAAQLNSTVIPPKSNFTSEINSLGLADEIGSKVNSQGMTLKDKIYMGFCVILIGVLLYMLM